MMGTPLLFSQWFPASWLKGTIPAHLGELPKQILPSLLDALELPLLRILAPQPALSGTSSVKLHLGWFLLLANRTHISNKDPQAGSEEAASCLTCALSDNPTQPARKDRFCAQETPRSGERETYEGEFPQSFPSDPAKKRRLRHSFRSEAVWESRKPKAEQLGVEGTRPAAHDRGTGPRGLAAGQSAC